MSSKGTVVVGMSGGVDSSLTAALLLQDGYEVVGVTMRLWEDDSLVESTRLQGCCALSAVEDAKRVAALLGIPHYVLNFREPFKQKVVDYFVQEYISGKTPNPCIACNRYIKFDLLFQKSIALGARYVATGHYAISEYDQEKKRFLLRKGYDHAKDQSYVLYHIKQNQLSQFLLPLGKYSKDQTRLMAQKLALPVANKPDSQEICFIPDNDYKGFISRISPTTIQPGNFVDIHGKILGRHQGLAMYTVGQRKGLGIAAGKPVYVVRLNPEKNEVVLGDHNDIFSVECIATDLNFLAIDGLFKPMLVQAKIRYSAHESPAMIKPLENGDVHICFENPQRAITPGQSIVFYDNDVVIGGGTINTVI